MRLRVVAGSAGTRAEPLQPLLQAGTTAVHGDASVGRVTLADGGVLFLCGQLVGLRDGTASLRPVGPALTELRGVPRTELARVLEGRYVAALVNPDGACTVWTDAFGQADAYICQSDGACVVATDLDLLPAAARASGGWDQLALAHALTVYGCRPPKRHTILKGVRRLGIGDTAEITRDRCAITQPAFHPAVTREYGEAQLDEYADLLLDAVKARASDEGNVVYLSSGWDSTALLACLVHLFGPRKVRAVIGRQQYAARTGVINQFEIDRARAVADYFGVHLDFAEFDYRHEGASIVDEVRPLFSSQQLASVTGLNHWLLARRAAETGHPGEIVFAGEISDGAHNLGFSQFVTIFHPVLAFREYSDKMASFLFGPTALGLLQEGTFETDPIYQLLRSRTGGAAFDAPLAAPDRARQLLASFFLRPSRVPLWSLDNLSMLTAGGRAAYSNEMETAYLPAHTGAVTPDTLYSWYLHLYNSFHWQGSTVATFAITASAAGLRSALPFWDARLQAFLATMPESWGRGLDLNPTKYPLKWMLKHRVRYPMHLQVGPHSYLYDVDPTFSHSAELLYGSALGRHFKSVLAARDYKDVLSPDVFNLSYLDAMVDRYLGGSEVRGMEMNDLLVLSLVTAFGWFARA